MILNPHQTILFSSPTQKKKPKKPKPKKKAVGAYPPPTLPPPFSYSFMFPSRFLIRSGFQFTFPSPLPFPLPTLSLFPVSRSVLTSSRIGRAGRVGKRQIDRQADRHITPVGGQGTLPMVPTYLPRQANPGDKNERMEVGNGLELELQLELERVQ